jgi:putative ABC transport system permease protein
MRISWVFLPQVIAITILVCLFVTVAAGYLGTWKALGEKASTHLRNK